MEAEAPANGNNVRVGDHWKWRVFNILRIIYFLPLLYMWIRVMGTGNPHIYMDFAIRLMFMAFRLREGNPMFFMYSGVAFHYVLDIIWPITRDGKSIWRPMLDGINYLFGCLPGSLFPFLLQVRLAIGGAASMIWNSCLTSPTFLGLASTVLAIVVFKPVIRYWVYKKLVEYLRQVGKGEAGGGAANNDSNNPGAFCAVCQDRKVCFMARPCKHVSVCDICVLVLTELRPKKECVMCRVEVSNYDRVFLP